MVLFSATYKMVEDLMLGRLRMMKVKMTVTVIMMTVAVAMVLVVMMKYMERIYHDPWVFSLFWAVISQSHFYSFVIPLFFSSPSLSFYSLPLHF